MQERRNLNGRSCFGDIGVWVLFGSIGILIRTGSYPQIIHAREKAVEGGIITCEEFVDANGRRYDDWIPAIRLGWE